MKSNDRKIDYAHLPKTEAKKFLVESIRKKRRQEDDSVPLWKRKKTKQMPSEQTIKPSDIPTKPRSRGGSKKVFVNPKTKSKYSGVSWTEKQGGMWKATLVYKRKSYDLGLFDFETSAASAVDKKYVILAGDFADQDRLNFRGKFNEYRRQISAAKQRRREKIERQKQQQIHMMQRQQQIEAKRRKSSELAARSKYEGVRKNKHNWEAFFQFQGQVYRSFHRSEIEAAMERDKMFVQYAGKYFPDPSKLAAKLNFPERLVSPKGALTSPAKKTKENPLKKAVKSPLRKAISPQQNPLRKGNPLRRQTSNQNLRSPLFQPTVVPNVVRSAPVIPTFGGIAIAGVSKPTFSN